jgi:tetratricopeptide (TPR) repeat protein
LLEEARKAGGTAQQLSAIDKKMAQAYNNRSHVYFDRKEYQVSEKDASQAMSLDNSLLEAQVNLGNARFKLNKTQAALQDYNRVIQRQPSNRNLLAGTYTNRGNLQLSLDNPEAALQDYNQAITLDPTYADAYFNRGLLHESRGNAAQAMQDYEKAAALYGQQGQSDLQKKATERAANLKRD